MPGIANHTPTVGDTELARAFYTGRHTDIVAATFDSDREVAPIDVAWVVGALTFVDRVDDARACFDVWRAGAGGTAPGDRRTLAASRFFLGLAFARAGYFDRALDLLVREGARARHEQDPWVRAFVFQGIACYFYFTGRYPGAARNALRALQEAHAAKLPYVQQLGTELRGHALVQIGQLQRGIALLEQARRQAHRLGLVSNAFAVDTSIATYTTRFEPRREALDRVQELVRRSAPDSHSQRALLTEAAVQLALRGRRSEAIAAIEAADRDALRGDTRRGRIASLLARLWVMRWQRGPAACRELVEQAAELVESRDVAFRAELLGFDILVARAIGDGTRAQRSLDELRALWRASRHFCAKAGLAQYDHAGRPSAFDEDAVTPLLRAVVQHDHGALSRIVALGVLGVVPELLGLTPSRRIIVVPSEDLVLLEDHGDVIARERPPRWCSVLLRLLASGDASKPQIAAGLWGLNAYRPEVHDPPVRTAVHRLRTFLQPHGDWIESTGGCYRAAVPVHLVGRGEPPVADSAPRWEDGALPVAPPARSVCPTAAAPSAAAPASATSQAVYHRLREVEQASIPQLARSLELSQSTVLRALRTLVAERRVERVGCARATRYRLRAAS